MKTTAWPHLLLIILMALTLLGLGGCSSQTDSSDDSDARYYEDPLSGAPGANPPGAGPYRDPMPMDGQGEEQPSEATSDNFFYFSYDDSASTAVAELAKHYIENQMVPPAAWGRAYEFLNLEKFDGSEKEEIGLFKANMGIWSHADPSTDASEDRQIYELGTYLEGPFIDKADRRNVVLTLLVDVSGSMDGSYGAKLDEEGSIKTLLDVAKYGLEQMVQLSLKQGDVINLVQFSSRSDEEDVLLQGWNYDVQDTALLDTITSLRTIGSTNLNAGIERAYLVAQETFDPEKANRVVILTDAYANTGEVDANVISQKTKINEMEGIHFSGLGIGPDFQEAFLNELTEQGKGSYFAVITPHDARRTFGERFVALVQVAAKNVRFRLDYPEGLVPIKSAAEEVSQNKEDVQPTNFSYNTSQFFLESFQKDSSTDLGEATFKLTIDYELPDGTQQTEILQKTLSELLNRNLDNTKDAFVIVSLADLIGQRLDCEEQILVKDSLLPDYQSDLADEYFSLADQFCGRSK